MFALGSLLWAVHIDAPALQTRHTIAWSRWDHANVILIVILVLATLTITASADDSDSRSGAIAWSPSSGAVVFELALHDGPGHAICAAMINRGQNGCYTVISGARRLPDRAAKAR